jgi:hypothetical protein
MRRTVIAATLIAAFVLPALPAQADDDFLFARHPRVDQRVAVTGLAAAVVGTATYFSLAHRHGHHGVNWGVWGATTVGCMVLSPIVASAMVPERPLTGREVAVLEGSCIVPIVGGLLVNAIYDANPQWEAPARPVRVARKKKAKM